MTKIILLNVGMKIKMSENLPFSEKGILVNSMNQISEFGNTVLGSPFLILVDVDQLICVINDWSSKPSYAL